MISAKTGVLRLGWAVSSGAAVFAGASGFGTAEATSPADPLAGAFVTGTAGELAAETAAAGLGSGEGASWGFIVEG